MRVSKVKSSVPLQWYEDHRYHPSHQAAYLGKLSRWRKDLLDQEELHLHKDLRRFQENDIEQQRLLLQRTQLSQRSLFSCPQESMPERHKRLLTERWRRFECTRRSDPHPDIGVIEGKRFNEKSPESIHPVSPFSEDDLTTIIQQQTMRLPITDKVSAFPHDESESLTINSKKATGTPSDAKENTSPLHEIQFHQKDLRGLYHGLRRWNTAQTSTNDLDLTPDSFKFDLPESLLRRGRPYQQSPFVSPRVDKSFPAATKLQRPLNQSFFKQNIGSGKSNQVLYIQHSDTMEHSTPLTLSQPVQHEILRQHRLHLKHRRKQSSMPTCFFCQNPSLSMISVGMGQYIIAHSKVRETKPEATQPNDSLKGPCLTSIKQRSQTITSIKRSSTIISAPRSPSPKFDFIINRIGDANSVSNGAPQTPVASECGEDDHAVKRDLTIEMPSLSLRPATPHHETTQGENPSLVDAVAQNQERGKEVRALLDDVKQLNNASASLENKVFPVQNQGDNNTVN